ncbi:MAG: hypothetical protein HRT35_16020 [Algicola sp.]|nr:hypothetical protein [Algicola sp.]
MKRILMCFILVGLSSPSLADTWFKDIGAKYNRIEQEANGTIWLMRPMSNLAPLNIEGCNFTQVKLIPPAGRESAYLSMVMAAITSKGALTVWGNCSTNSTVIATRLTVEL